jgi:hypothetical protein
MENNELKNIWKNIDSEFQVKSNEELNQLLSVKIRKTINKFLYVFGLSIFICSGVIIFLIIATLNRQNDMLYVINNLVLGTIILTALIASLYGWYSFQNNRYNQPLKFWLEERIIPLSRKLEGRRSLYSFVLIPVVYSLMVLSIHVYYENKSFLEVMHNEESVIALLVGAPIGLFISFLASRKIRKYELKSLESLKKLHSLL